MTSRRSFLKSSTLLSIAIGWIFILNAQPQSIRIPYTQWTIGNNNKHVSWHFTEEVECNGSFIKGPEPGEWEEWYNSVLNLKAINRQQIGKKEPYLFCQFPTSNKTAFHFDKFAYQLNLSPGEEITISGKTRTQVPKIVLYINYHVKLKGKELSYDVRKRIDKRDSIIVNGSKEWRSFSKTLKIPEFDNASYTIVPEISIDRQSDKFEFFIKDIEMKMGYTYDRGIVEKRISTYLEKQANNSELKIKDTGLTWTNQNYVMGFIFVWDRTFWDNKNKKYLVDEYCTTMEKEFGGIQSVVLWHSYPNIGIDERNQFEMLHAMPGGIDGVRKAVADFHKQGVRVFITYNPWDMDTNRPENHDFVELAKVLDQINADGVYLDTWHCSKGSISLFEVENSIRDEAAKLGRSVAFTTEILPEAKDLVGPDALTSSWGQEIHPYNYTDLSYIKWIMPDHKQYYIKRMLKERKPIMVHAWINGQGLQLWENIFGTMNLWSAPYRKTLRKMNAIWQTFGELYLTDEWKPLIPTANKHIIASQWTHPDFVITNFVDTVRSTNRLKYPVQNINARYFDIWNGMELKPFSENGQYYVNIDVNDFGCLLQTSSKKLKKLTSLLKKQRRETVRKLPVIDRYASELSIKTPLVYDYKSNTNITFNTPLLKLESIDTTLSVEHIWREGQCYPNMEAKDNHDLQINLKNGQQFVIHNHKVQIKAFDIMPRVVTNAQFEQFLIETGYTPRYKENFLKHWNGDKCPEAIKDEPVVYVCLDDARAFAEWAGMQLPTEWEWQLAAEKYKDEFKFNEVYELNESLRFDGFNYSVSLRGDCSRWNTSSSSWYITSSVENKEAYGVKKHNSHVKFFLMYPGYDRTSTIGFRCIKR